MDVEIPKLYELLLKEAAKTASADKEIAEAVFRYFMERNEDSVE